MARAAPLKRKLNDQMIRRLPPRDVAYLVWDSFQRGLAVQVQPTGRKSFKVIFRAHGRPRWLNLGGGIGVKVARKLAAKHMAAVAEGNDPAAERTAQRSKGTFGELVTSLPRPRQAAQQVVEANRDAVNSLRLAAVEQASGGGNHAGRCRTAARRHRCTGLSKSNLERC